MYSRAVHTKGPWVWTSAHAGPKDDYDCETRGPINIATFESVGYIGNPELYGPDFAEDCVLSAGSGEYSPIHGKTQAEKVANAHLIAAAPEMLEALKEAIELLESYVCEADSEASPNGRWPNIRKAIAKAEGVTP